jgi:hypothetical protein
MRGWVGAVRLRTRARVVESICTAVKRKVGAHEHAIAGGGSKRTAVQLLPRGLRKSLHMLQVSSFSANFPVLGPTLAQHFYCLLPLSPPHKVPLQFPYVM